MKLPISVCEESFRPWSCISRKGAAYFQGGVMARKAMRFF